MSTKVLYARNITTVPTGQGVSVDGLLIQNGSVGPVGVKADTLQSTPISATSPLTNQSLIFDGTNWVASNVSLTTGVTGIMPISNGGTGLSSLGSSNQILGVNSGGTALEYKSTLAVNTTGSAATLTTPRTINGVAFDGSTNITVPSDIILDTAATPKYPQDLSKGVWYGLNTNANAFDATCVTLGQNANTDGIASVSIGRGAGGVVQSVAIGDGATNPGNGTTIVLTNTSNNQQYVSTGNTNTTITLPVASTMQLGQHFRIVNNMTLGTLTVNSSGGNFVATIPPRGWCYTTCILTSGTTAASWSWERGGQATSGSFSFSGRNTNQTNTAMNTEWGTVFTNINGGGNNLMTAGNGTYVVPNGFAGLYAVNAYYNSGDFIGVTLYAGSTNVTGIQANPSGVIHA